MNKRTPPREALVSPLFLTLNPACLVFCPALLAELRHNSSITCPNRIHDMHKSHAIQNKKRDTQTKQMSNCPKFPSQDMKHTFLRSSSSQHWSNARVKGPRLWQYQAWPNRLTRLCCNTRRCRHAKYQDVKTRVEMLGLVGVYGRASASIIPFHPVVATSAPPTAQSRLPILCDLYLSQLYSLLQETVDITNGGNARDLHTGRGSAHRACVQRRSFSYVLHLSIFDKY